jgi:hypothetical protein
MLSMIPILMLSALTKTVNGTYSPTLFGVTLPWPIFPFTGPAEELVFIRYELNMVFAGRLSWQVFLKGMFPVYICSIAAISAMLWYALILLGTASRRADRDAMERNA